MKWTDIYFFSESFCAKEKRLQSDKQIEMLVEELLDNFSHEEQVTILRESGCDVTNLGPRVFYNVLWVFFNQSSDDIVGQQ